MRRRRFKDRTQAQVYDTLRTHPPADPKAARGKGAVHNAYYIGWLHPQGRTQWLRTSAAYAGWAAGVDNARAAAKRAAP